PWRRSEAAGHFSPNWSGPTGGQVLRWFLYVRLPTFPPAPTRHEVAMKPSRVALGLLVFLGSAAPAAAQTATLGVTFNGTNSSQSGFYPPDTQGAVGPNHIVEMVNGRFQVFTKAGGSAVQSTTLNQFWASNTYQISNNSFDP